jgi:hypothetical protein
MKARDQRRRLFFGGITGGSFVAVTQLVTRDVIQWPHLIALICFAVVLPFAAMFTNWWDEFPIEDLPRAGKRAFQLIATVVGILFWIAIAALFFALRPLLCVIFVASAVVAMLANDSAVEFWRKARSKNSKIRPDGGSGNVETPTHPQTPQSGP